MAHSDDLSRCFTAFEQDSTLVCVVEMSASSWVVAGLLPGVERRPLKKISADAEELTALIERWRKTAVNPVKRIVAAYEAGRDGFWLARLMRAKDIEAYVINPASVAVSREHKRAKTDRLDAEMLLRALLGWLRGERDHCQMAAIASLAEEDMRRPCREREALVKERTRLINRLKSVMTWLGIKGFNPKLRKAAEKLERLRTPLGEPIPANTKAEVERDLARLALLREQIASLEKSREERLSKAEAGTPWARMMTNLLRIVAIGPETAELLVGEVFSRRLRDRRALARYAGLTGSPDESGARRREKGLAKSGNARVRKAMLELAWRMLFHQKASGLSQWFRARTEGPGARRKTTMIVALARKLLIALWRFLTTGEIPEGLILRPAASA
jgi:transposase